MTRHLIVGVALVLQAACSGSAEPDGAELLDMLTGEVACTAEPEVFDSDALDSWSCMTPSGLLISNSWTDDRGERIALFVNSNHGHVTGAPGRCGPTPAGRSRPANAARPRRSRANSTVRA